MSDLQDIIVTSSVKAFNSGLAHGVIQERERIIKLLEEYLHKLLHNHGLVIIPEQFESLISLIKGEQK